MTTSVFCYYRKRCTDLYGNTFWLHTLTYVRPATYRNVSPAKSQRSETSLGAVWIAKNVKSLHADNEDSGRNAGRYVFLRYVLYLNDKDIICAKHEKGLYAICGQRRPRSACAYAQADQGLHCPLTESMDTVVHDDEQRMLRSDCTDAHADLDLRCPQIG